MIDIVYHINFNQLKISLRCLKLQIDVLHRLKSNNTLFLILVNLYIIIKNINLNKNFKLHVTGRKLHFKESTKVIFNYQLIKITSYSSQDLNFLLNPH